MEGVRKIIEELREYAGSIDELGVKMLRYNIEHLGLDFVIERTFKDLDCTRLWNGRTICQTISAIYKGNLSEIFYIIDNYDVSNKEYLYERIATIHQRNLEYEAENPPIVYKDKKQKVSKGNKEPRAKQTKLFNDVPTKRISKFMNLNIIIK